jgi:hypothetical protein
MYKVAGEVRTNSLTGILNCLLLVDEHFVLRESMLYFFYSSTVAMSYCSLYASRLCTETVFTSWREE